jgi:multidrug efflux pump subunit AcrA (membrane-fusion protein)
MKLNRWMALMLMTSLGAALFVWSHARTKAYKSVNAAPTKLLRNGLILPGTVFPMITTPIVGRDLNLAVPLNVWVKQGDVIGTVQSQVDPGNRERAWQELEEARTAEQRAEDEVRQAEEELSTVQTQVSSMDREEAAADTAKFDAEREFERQDAMLRSGLTSRFDYNAAATARDSSEAATYSIRSELADSAIVIDEWQAKALEAETTLREATTRRNAAEGVFQRMQGSPTGEPVIAPADGILVTSGETARGEFGIASDSRQLCAHAMVRQADLMAVRVGQQARIVLDADPEEILRGTVSAISEAPIDLSEGTFYEVTFVVENPGGTWLSSAAMHAHMAVIPEAVEIHPSHRPTPE